MPAARQVECTIAVAMTVLDTDSTSDTNAVACGQIAVQTRAVFPAGACVAISRARCSVVRDVYYEHLNGVCTRSHGFGYILGSRMRKY